MSNVDKHMARIRIGFVDYVMPVTKATQRLQAVETAERYQDRYRSDEDGGPMHHVGSEAPKVEIELSDYDTYLQGKFTGKPDTTV